MMFIMQCLLNPLPAAESWADALHRWLGITADRMHIVHSGKDAANVPNNIQFLIVSYNFVQKMVGWVRQTQMVHERRVFTACISCESQHAYHVQVPTTVVTLHPGSAGSEQAVWCGHLRW